MKICKLSPYVSSINTFFYSSLIFSDWRFSESHGSSLET